MENLDRILFALVMGASVTAGLLVVPTFARGTKGAGLTAALSVLLLAWLVVSVATASSGSSHVAVAPVAFAVMVALWLGVAPLRRAWLGVSMTALVALQTLRFVGSARVLAVHGGWLPNSYGRVLGAADVGLALTAIALAWAWSRGAGWARQATLAWSAAGLIATAGGLMFQAQVVRPTPGFEGLWSAFLTPLLAALLVVAGYRSLVRPAA